MTRELRVVCETWPIAGSFRIARGAKSEAQTLVAEIVSGTAVGRGECVPYARYGETVESVAAAITDCAASIRAGLTREALQELLPAGAARNALDSALLDLESKLSGKPPHILLDLSPPVPVPTFLTLSLDTPEYMAAAAAAAIRAGHQQLKLKLGGDEDLLRVEAVRAVAPHAMLIADVNEGWTIDDLQRLLPALVALRISLIEQPLPAGDDEALQGFTSPIPICADESCHSRNDLARIVGRYSHINVKLDKSGGLTEAIVLIREARKLGLGVMAGCMISTSLSIAPALQLSALADFIDLDAPLWLTRDRAPAIYYHRGFVHSAQPGLWG